MDEPVTSETTPEATTAVAAVETPPEITGPWAQDLESTFTDPTVRGQVDDFMRTKYQPYVTGLETKAAELEHAADFVRDLQENPVETYLELTKLLGGDELSAAVQQLLTPEEQAEVVEQLEQQSLDPELEEIKRERREQRAMDQYESQLEQLNLSESELELFHPLVIAHDGDIQAAHSAWPAYLTQVKAALGISEEVSPAEVPDPPSVLGSDTRSVSTPPLEQKAKSMDEALDQFFSAKAPQTVGMV